MENNPIRNIPDDKTIEELLSQFSPQPTPRFYIKIAVAPWQNRIPAGGLKLTRHLKPGRKLVWGLAAVGLVLAILVITFIPSVRVAASQIIHLFLPAPSNQLDIQVTLTSPGDLIDFSDPTNFPLSFKEVQQQVDFGVKGVSSLPEGLTFIGARYDPRINAVTLLYEAPDYKIFLTQRPRRNSEDVFSIGASATVKNVKIGTIQGEFVMGGWKAISTQPTHSNETSTSRVNIYAIWDNELSQSTLRWQAGDIIYELRSNGEGSPSQSELINWANGLK